MFFKLLNAVSDGLIAIGQKLKDKSPQPITYFPPLPVGEIRPRKHRGTIAYFWLYDENGERKSKYLSRDKAKAEEKREELSGFLNHQN